jgi:TM2 domain-containing membrane protein YozV
MNTPMPAALPYEYPELAFAQGMDDRQRAVYFNAFSGTRKDVTTGVLLALLLGGIGAHRFYMGEIGWGVVYLLFSWTAIPMFVGFIEAFLMPERVRAFNAVQAHMLAVEVRANLAPLRAY